MKPLLVLVMLLAGTALARDLAQPDPSERPAVTYYGDGTLKSSTTYRDGLRSGPAAEFFADGSPRSRGEYRAGQRSGEWTFWLSDGSVDTDHSGVYVDGALSR